MSNPNFAIRTIPFVRRGIQTAWERIECVHLSGWLIAILGIGWLLWLSAPFLLLGPLGYVRSIELGDAIYPQVAYIVETLRQGKFSLWLPSQGGGTDLLGNFNSPYLNVALYAALPVWLANNLIFLVVTASAAASVYILLRHSFRCSIWAAALGGGLYTTWFLLNFGGLVFAYAAGLAFALAPLLLHWLLSVRDWSMRSFGLSLLLGLAIAFGGHYTWTAFILGGVFFCALVLAPERCYVWLPHLILIGSVTALLQLPLFVANVETAPFSARTVETYYRSERLWPLLRDYFTQNLDPLGFNLIKISIGLGAVAVFLSDSRWRAVAEARPLWSLAFVFALLPVLDVAVLYVLSAVSVGGFAFDENGGFGGPFDCRLRLSRAFIVCAAAAISVDLLWRMAALPKRLRELVDFDWSARALTVRFGEAGTLLGVALAAGALGVGGATVWRLVKDTRANVAMTRTMAINGLNFAALYQHPQLRALAAGNPAFDTYRVATVQLNGPDTAGGVQCCGIPEGSLFGTFQNAYGFEIADAYMSNLTARSVNFWNILVTGHPGFPRAEFSLSYAKKFMYPERAFTQKLYLFEPINSVAFDKDGCVRRQEPIDFSANYDLDMLSLVNVAFVISGIPLRDWRLALLESDVRDDLKALQCASRTTHRRAFRERGLAGRPLYIYRNRDVVSRVFAPKRVEIVADEAAMYRALASRSASELRETALLEGPGFPSDVRRGGDLQVDVTGVETVRGDHLRIAVRSETGGIVVTSASYSPYWRAFAGDEALPVFPAYHSLIGVWVPPGQLVVDLKYRPPYARWLGYSQVD